MNLKLTTLALSTLALTACATTLPNTANTTSKATTQTAVQTATSQFKAFDTKQAEPFTGKVLIEGLTAWDMAIDANETLWVSERADGALSKIDPTTGKKTAVHTFTDVVAGSPQQGFMGFTLGEKFLKGDNSIFASYSYSENGKDWLKIVHLTLDESTSKVIKSQTILDKIESGTDHQGGRLRLGADGKLYYSIGDFGYNQYANTCRMIESQRLPTAKELANKDYEAYKGKVLRFNTDGSIPSDNPVLNGVKSHIYSYGHRNPQGLVFVGDKLYSSEQGPAADDEINLIEKGANYGWPHISGYPDDQNYVYANFSAHPDCAKLGEMIGDTIPEGTPTQKETAWKQPANYRNPLKTFFTVRDGHNLFDPNCGNDYSYLCWPTAALSSIAYYPADGKVKEWQNSILVTGLKSGGIYRMPLNGTKDAIQGETYKHFTSPNRYRNVAVNQDGSRIYVITDNGGWSLGLDGKPNLEMANKGAVLMFKAK